MKIGMIEERLGAEAGECFRRRRSGESAFTRHQPEDDAHATAEYAFNDTGWEETGHIALLALRVRRSGD